MAGRHQTLEGRGAAATPANPSRPERGRHPGGVLVAPLIPVLNEPELETILEAVREVGALEAGYVMLRLPALDCARFIAPRREHPQYRLF